METVTGKVSKIFPNEGKPSGPGLKIDGNGTVYAGTLDLSGITEGCHIVAEGEKVGSKGNIKATSIKLAGGAQSAPAAASGGQATGSGGRGRYNSSRPANADERIAMQNCHGVAAAVLGHLLAHDIVALPAKATSIKGAEIKQPEKLDASLALFDLVADKLFARVMAARVDWVPTAEYAGVGAVPGNATDKRGDFDPDDDIPF